jgi:hypothetical protein
VGKGFDQDEEVVEDVEENVKDIRPIELVFLIRDKKRRQ